MPGRPVIIGSCLLFAVFAINNGQHGYAVAAFILAFLSLLPWERFGYPAEPAAPASARNAVEFSRTSLNWTKKDGAWLSDGNVYKVKKQGDLYHLYGKVDGRDVKLVRAGFHSLEGAKEAAQESADRED